MSYLYIVSVYRWLESTGQVTNIKRHCDRFEWLEFFKRSSKAENKSIPYIGSLFNIKCQSPGVKNWLKPFCLLKDFWVFFEH